MLPPLVVCAPGMAAVIGLFGQVQPKSPTSLIDPPVVILQTT
jgi:hypothetical protein